MDFDVVDKSRKGAIAFDLNPLFSVFDVYVKILKGILIFCFVFVKWYGIFCFCVFNILGLKLRRI
jgi:hypothetical protein